LRFSPLLGRRRVIQAPWKTQTAVGPSPIGELRQPFSEQKAVGGVGGVGADGGQQLSMATTGCSGLRQIN